MSIIDSPSLILACLPVMQVQEVLAEFRAAQELVVVLEVFPLDNHMELHPQIHKVVHPHLSTLSRLSHLADFLPAPNRRLVRLSQLCQHF